MKSGPNTIFAIIAAVIGVAIGGAPMPCAGVPVITAEQIEADWHRQDELYNLEVARAAGESDAPAVDCNADNTAANFTRVIERGLMLAENLRERGVSVEHEVRTLRRIVAEFESPGENVSRQRRAGLYLGARWAVRRMALRNPLLDFDAVLFAKAAPTRFPHISDQYYGWWSRPGGGIFVLEGFRGDKPRLRCLTSDWAEGSYLRPDLSYDGRKVIFAYCRYHEHVPEIKNKADKSNVPEDAFYHIFEMNIDGTGGRQLTHGRYDDFDARYLPSGEIAFLSTRKGVALQCGKASAAATEKADLPDSYVRCGGGEYRPVPVFTLHKMDGDGGNLRAISAFENFEWNPAVAEDGRILYTRWDYIDRFNGHFFSLWSTNPDGTNAQLVYGNYTTKPQAVLEARPVPDSHKIIFTGAAHHSITGGSLVLLDRTRGTEGADPIVRLTPEVPFPETEAWADMYYANPYPLSEQHYLVAWSDRRLPPHSRVDESEKNPTNATGLYLFDAFGNLNLLYRDPNISSTCPIPVRPRKRQPVLFDGIRWDGAQEGAFLVHDVYRSLDAMGRGEVKRIRVIGVPPKTQPRMDNPNLGVSKEDPGKFVLGTVPVEADGSAYFRVPSGIPVFFQVLDGEGMAVQTMRSLTYVQPGQTLGCVGCHESREHAPPVGARPAAWRREASRLTPGPPGTWPLRFDGLVQPVLDKLCVRCHRSDGENEEAGCLDLTAAKAYENLLSFADNDLKDLAFEKDKSVAGECPARKSQLLALLREGPGHEGVQLDADSFERLVTWMDVYAQKQGSFSETQEDALRRLRRQVASLLAK
ncbi:MAG: HzsA-related protein [Planctomycetota bacterium]